MFARINQFRVFLLIAFLALIVLAPTSASAKTSAAKSADETFQPDVYPSAGQASARLGREIADALHRTYGNSEKVPPILVRTDSSSAPCPAVSSAGEELSRSLREEFGDQTRATASEFGGDGADHVVVTLSAERVTQNLPMEMAGAPWAAATLIAQVASSRVNDSFDVEFSEKPWVTNWAAFVNGANPNARWFHAQSNKTCLTAEEAESAARKAAAEQLAPFIRAQLGPAASASASSARGNVVMTRTQTQAPPPGSIETVLRVDPSIVADRFIQRYQRPYGTVWQAQILVNGSPAKIEAIARQVSAQTRARADTDAAIQKQRTREAAATGGSLLGLIAVIVLVYLGLNAATKGYFTGRLRAMAMLAMIVGAVGIYGLLHQRESAWSPAVVVTAPQPQRVELWKPRPASIETPPPARQAEPTAPAEPPVPPQPPAVADPAHETAPDSPDAAAAIPSPP